MNRQLSEEVKALGLVKRYGGKLAVNDLSFGLEPGKITGFLGLYGAGKTTTIQLMLGLIHGEGRTLFGGQNYRDLKVPGRAVGALLDSRPFHPTRTTMRASPARDCARVCAAAGGTSCSRSLDALAPRELEVLSLMAEGRSNACIVRELPISVAAVECNVTRSFDKLRLHESACQHRRVPAVLKYLHA